MMSQKEKVLRALRPGDLVYAYMSGCCDGFYQVGETTRFGPVLLGVKIATPPWSAIFPPF